MVAILKLYRKLSTYSEKFSKSHQAHKTCLSICFSITLCREVLDGLRIYFDHTLNGLLLYNQEKGQIETKQAVFQSVLAETKL